MTRPPAGPPTPDAPDPAEHWVVDALEDSPHGPLARLERPDGSTFTLPLSDLPPDLHEGDILAVTAGADGITTHLLPQETAARRAERQAELNTLNAQGEQTALPTNEKGEITL